MDSYELMQVTILLDSQQIQEENHSPLSMAPPLHGKGTSRNQTLRRLCKKLLLLLQPLDLQTGHLLKTQFLLPPCVPACILQIRRKAQIPGHNEHMHICQESQSYFSSNYENTQITLKLKQHCFYDVMYLFCFFSFSLSPRPQIKSSSAYEGTIWQPLLLDIRLPTSFVWQRLPFHLWQIFPYQNIFFTVSKGHPILSRRERKRYKVAIRIHFKMPNSSFFLVSFFFFKFVFICFLMLMHQMPLRDESFLL